MTALEAVPGVLEGIVKTVDLFSSPTASALVFIDDGATNAKQEDALNSVGWCVVISPLLLSIKSQTSASPTAPRDGSLTGLAVTNVLAVIIIRTNPKANKGSTAINVYQALRKIMKAVLSWVPGMGERGFELVHDSAADPDFQDTGNFTYQLRVVKQVSI